MQGPPGHRPILLRMGSNAGTVPYAIGAVAPTQTATWSWDCHLDGLGGNQTRVSGCRNGPHLFACLVPRSRPTTRPLPGRGPSVRLSVLNRRGPLLAGSAQARQETTLVLSSLDRDHRTFDLFRCGGSTALGWALGPVRNKSFGYLMGAKRPSRVLLGGRTTRRPRRIPPDRRGGGWRSHPGSWPWQCHGSPLTARTRHRRSSGPRDDRSHEDDRKTLCSSVLP